MIRNMNDGTQAEPYLRRDLNLGTLADLPEWSSAPKAEGKALLEAIKEAGFKGVQGGDPDLCRDVGLACTAGGRINDVGEAHDLAKRLKSDGYEAATVHVGWGIEDDATVDGLLEDIINASVKYDFPLYVETHRATITQDIWRTVEFVKRHPQIRFNGDFSHWYTGLELPYGSIEDKFEFMQPVLDRVRFLHGRIGNSSHMQMKFDGTEEFVVHFETMWIRSMQGFLKTAQPGDFMCFNPELLPSGNNYARLFEVKNGDWREESDRWQQALLMSDIAEACFEEARCTL
jgi:hypothetical protein